MNNQITSLLGLAIISIAGMMGSVQDGNQPQTGSRSLNVRHVEIESDRPEADNQQPADDGRSLEIVETIKEISPQITEQERPQTGFEGRLKVENSIEKTIAQLADEISDIRKSKNRDVRELKNSFEQLTGGDTKTEIAELRGRIEQLESRSLNNAGTFTPTTSQTSYIEGSAVVSDVVVESAPTAYESYDMFETYQYHPVPIAKPVIYFHAPVATNYVTTYQTDYSQVANDPVIAIDGIPVAGPKTKRRSSYSAPLRTTLQNILRQENASQVRCRTVNGVKQCR